MRWIHRALGAACLLLFACAGPGAPHSGQLVIVGGGLRAENAEVFTAFMERAGERTVVLPTASGVPEESGPGTAADLLAYAGPGQAVEVVAIFADTPERALEGEWVAALEQADAVWFTGGDQSRILDVFRPAGGDTPAYRAVISVLDRGGCVAGTSAGAAMMSDPMIAGGSSADALRYGLHDDREDRGLKLQPGMGFFPFGIVDQHFLRRGRVGRLIVALESAGQERGYGVADNCALAVDLEGARGFALGDRAVLAIDAGAVQRAGLARRGLRISLLSSGDELDFRSGVLRPDPAKLTVEGGGDVSEEELDAWDTDTLTQLLERLSGDPARAQSARGEGFTLIVRADQRTRFLARNADLEDLSVIDAILDVEPNAAAAADASVSCLELASGRESR